MSDIVLYTHPKTRGRIARWMLEETGAPYRVEPLEYGPAMKTPEYRQLNPMGKVPTLVHGEAVVTEVGAILAYLADVFPEAGLAPPPGRRADYYRWLFFGQGPLDAAMTDKAMDRPVPEDRAQMSTYGRYDATMDALEHAVGKGGFVAGDTFTAADVLIASLIGWGLKFRLIEERPAFTDYYGRIRGREAFRRASELDDALLENMAG